MTERETALAADIKLVFVVTDSITANYLLRGQLAFLARSGFEVILICSPGRHLKEVRVREGIPCYDLPMEREIAPLRDLQSLFGLIRLLRRLRPDIVSASTPKAGLLGMLAATLARVPHRVRTIRGLRLETTEGWKRALLSMAERTASWAADRVVCVSNSLRDEVLARNLAPREKVSVLGAGSSNGVDTQRFRPNSDEASNNLRRSLGLTPRTPVIGFVGRLVRDKGIDDLVRAFEEIVLDRLPESRLLVLGELEPGDPVSDDALVFLRDREQVIAPGFVENPEPWYQLMDVLAFPSYREGLPNAPLEAGASAIPTVGYAVTGTVDAVSSGITGQLVPKGDWRALGDTLCRYLEDADLRRRHGAAALARVQESFDQHTVWEQWRCLYSSLRDESGREEQAST